MGLPNLIDETEESGAIVQIREGPLGRFREPPTVKRVSLIVKTAVFSRIYHLWAAGVAVYPSPP